MPGRHRGGREQISRKAADALLTALAAGLLAVAVATASGEAPRLAPPVPALGKPTHIDSHLLGLAADRAGGRDVERAGRDQGLRVSGAGRVAVDVYVKGDVRAAAERLRAAGMKVEATSARAPFKIVEGWLPVAAIQEVGQLGSTRGVIPVTAYGTNAGSVQSQGDAAHRGPQARAQGPLGAGVKVGVLSDSIDQVGPGVAGSQASGDLPGSVDVLSDATSGSDEGRAIGEIIYDEAPGITQMAFASGTSPPGPLAKANAINALVASGVRLIADDIFYLTEPFFQDGVVAQAADAARAKGVAYLGSAGNRARQAWQGTYGPTPPGSGVDTRYHNFNPGGASDQLQGIVNVPGGGRLTVVMQWDEPFGAAETDLDLFLYRLNTDPPAFLDSDTTLNAGPGGDGLPVAWVTFTNSGGSSVPVGVAIRRTSGTRAPLMKWVGATNFGSFTPAEYNTGTPAHDVDASAARGALSIGAVDYSVLNQAEEFSSRGPVTRLFDRTGKRLAHPEVRRKPQLAAADGVSTGVFGFDPFFGTSAATPSAAGIAALILSAKPSNTAADAYAILTNPLTATDCVAPGNPDPDCGAGFVFADRAVRQALDRTPPTITPVLTPGSPSGSNGFYRGNVGLAWRVADSGSPIVSRSGCTPLTLAADTPAAGTSFSCSARSVGGTAAGSVTIKRDATPASLTKLRFSPKTFRVKARGKASAAAKKGSRIKFSLSEKATVKITIQKRKRGGGYRTVRSFNRSAKAGRNSIAFSGRIKKGRRKRKLRRGRYRIKVVARDSAGNTSKTKTARFRIVRR